MKTPDFPWLSRGHYGWNRAWSALLARVGGVDFTGWQYMGTDERGHCFRLRDNSGAGNPHRYEFVDAKPDDFNEARPS
jgi:hypothetical protein